MQTKEKTSFRAFPNPGDLNHSRGTKLEKKPATLRSIAGVKKNKRGSFMGVVEKYLGDKVKVNSRKKYGSKVWVNEKPGHGFGGYKVV
tara:strand:- start:1362 stop:1625 length:264 start_codon:yes stop_codon:yes gene_type:complete